MAIMTWPLDEVTSPITYPVTFADSVTFNGAVTFNSTIVYSSTVDYQDDVTFNANITASSASPQYLFEDTTAGTGTSVFRPFRIRASNAINGDGVSVCVGQSDTDYSEVRYVKGASGSAIRLYPDNDQTTNYWQVDYDGSANLVVGGTSMFGIASDGAISVTEGVGGTGDSSEPSIASYSSWSPSIVQSSGTSVTGLTVSNAWWYRQSNIVTCAACVEFTTGNQTAAEEYSLRLDIPVTKNFTNTNQISGSSSLDVEASGWVSGIVSSVRSNGTYDNANITINYPSAINAAFIRLFLLFEYTV